MSETANNVIGKFCSVAKKGTIILPKNIPGYIAPEGQVLEYDGQEFNFNYTPIQYSISYRLHGGIMPEADIKNTYTIEDPEYIPPNPYRDDYTFNGWEPKSIPAKSIGDIIFEAKWRPNAILLNGKALRDKLLELTGGDSNFIFAIQPSLERPTNYIDLSSTDTPIYASFDAGIVYIYSDYPIYCNLDMSGAFKGFELLRDISGLYDFICRKGTNISNLFENCTILSNLAPIELWANGEFSNITDAFTGTSALEAGRVPLWYRWNVKMIYKSSTGVEIESHYEDRIPKEVIYPKSIAGYKAVTVKAEVTSKDMECVFIYDPITYQINYQLDGGELLNPKLSYTTEDETYYPGEAYKHGFKFDHWAPESIPQGSTGNVTFVANYSV